MTREQIEKEAIKFAKSHYLDKYGRRMKSHENLF